MKKSLLIIVCLIGYSQIFAVDIYWYLAASLSKPGKVIVKNFNRTEKAFQVYLIIGGSGQLLGQLTASKKGDIYTPASESFLQKAENKGFLKSYQVLVHQTPVFGLSKEGEKTIKTFDDLHRKTVKIALGNSMTMALGKSYLEIEKRMNRENAKGIRKNSIVQAININQIVNYLRSDIVGAGLVFDTVARANRFRWVSIPKYANIQQQAYFTVLTFSNHPEKVGAFQKYLFQQDEVFHKFGFKLLHESL